AITKAVSTPPCKYVGISSHWSTPGVGAWKKLLQDTCCNLKGK
ncbi:unnamed protein product, partial [Penicillium nalgiovense]